MDFKVVAIIIFLLSGIVVLAGVGMLMGSETSSLARQIGPHMNEYGLQCFLIGLGGCVFSLVLNAGASAHDKKAEASKEDAMAEVDSEIALLEKKKRLLELRKEVEES